MSKYSYNTGVIPTFHIADYTLFGLILAVSAAIGLYYVFRDRKRNTPEQYFLGNRNMSVVPVTLSMLSSFISAITVLGVPAEMYTYNTMFWWIIVGFAIAAVGAAHIYIPVFYNLSLTSSFEYLELRFGRLVRVSSSFIYMIWMLLYMAVTLYGPALALNVVTGLSLWGSILAVGLVCTFYTTLGGMKAVLWTDTIQMCIMFIGTCVLLGKTSLDMGGFGNAWAIAEEKGRIKFLELDGDPRVRMSIWTNVIGGAVFWCCINGTNQAQIQRALSLPSLTKAKVTIWLNVLGYAAITSLSCMIGIVLFAFYSSCDPIKSNLVQKDDQLVALLTMDVLGSTPGLPGIILTTVFSGSLSTMSSGLNAIAAVILEDYVKPFCCTDIRHFQAKMMSMSIVLIGGIVSIGLAFLVSQFGSILQVAYGLFGILGGPLLGVFTLGILFPWANQWGAIFGQSVSLGLLGWIGLGTKIAKVSNAIPSPTSITECNFTSHTNSSDWIGNITATTAYALSGTVDNATTWITPAAINTDSDWLVEVYKLSHMWYSTAAVIITVVLGLLVSFMTGYTKPSEVDPRLICPIFDVFLPCLPNCIRQPLRFGVKHSLTSSGARRKASKIHISLSINEDLELERTSNGVPAIKMLSKEKSEQKETTDVETTDVETTALEYELNKEIDILTRDSMDLGLITELGQLKIELDAIPEESNTVSYVNSSFGKS